MHIVKVCAECGVLLRLSKNVDWVGVSDLDGRRIREADAKPVAIRTEQPPSDPELTFQATYGPVRREAEECWQKKDYFNGHWSVIEKARVAYAKKKIAGS